MHRSSFLKMQYFKDNYLNPDDDLKILDVGSFDRNGDYNYGMILNEEKWTYKGLDLKEGNNVDIVVEDPYNWKEIEDEAFDVVVSGQAFEHIEFFWLTLEQIKRVLKTEGLFCLIVPSSGPVHRNPYDCYRFNQDGMKSMAKYINFQVLETGTRVSDDAKPWYDSYLIAKKSESVSFDDLDNRITRLENKIDFIMSKLDVK
ncbi:class I SAM-dependent methyltransferase [Methanobrevibacter sp.]|uniref:class I SAM-dependent methyltransferase n=1 Tax=Methanobrevibacter sp. TaxID=66852 RepID=UPI003869B279